LETRPKLPPPVAQVFVTDELHRRAASEPDYLREKLAIQDLARQMADQPKEVLPRLVKRAMEICDAESAGVSILEPESEQFRWFGLSGVLATFEGTTTPRNSSPCGICLDMNGPILMEHPERAYDWIRDANISVPEVLLVPLAVKDSDAIGTLWIVSREKGHFNSGHARAMTELATFAGMALRMIQSEERLSLALVRQETLAREMSHRVKNLFAIMAGMIRITARNSATKDELVETLSARLRALADANSLVRRTFGSGEFAGVNFGELIDRVLRPYENARTSMNGPELSIGEQAINNLALVFHELATNAAKYGALRTDTGLLSVQWSVRDDVVGLIWTETGNPGVIEAPRAAGYGHKLVAGTVQSMGGQIEYDWHADGLSVHLQVPLAALKT
jgi:two-component sensor histidine kinase